MLTGQILLQLIVILISVQVFGYLCKRISQQWVIGEILAGLALGPSLLGALLPGVEGFIFPASTLGNDDRSVFANGGTAIMFHAAPGAGRPTRIACGLIVRPK